MANSRIKNNKTYGKLIFSLILLVVIGGAVGIILYNNHQNNLKIARVESSKKTGNANNINYSKPSSADNDASNSNKSSSSPSETLEDQGSSSGSNGSSTSSTFSVQINPVVNGSNVHIGTLVSGITSGSCIITATQSGQQTQQLGNSSVKLDVNYYDCGVFNIPTSNFPSSGTWTLTLTVNYNGESESGSSTISI